MGGAGGPDDEATAMRKWRSRTWTHVVLVAGAILSVPVPHAHAVASVESGWWTTSPVPIGPDVGDGQLLVQGGAAEPAAYAGATFVLDGDEQPQRLRLAVAPGSASTPATTLRLCPLSAPASAAAGEPAADGPAFDCSVTTVEAGPSSDGTTYEFDVSAFVAEASFDVAVLPTQSSDRVVLSAPAVDALEVASDPTAGGSTPSSSPGPAPLPSTGGGGTTSFDPGTGGSSLSPPTASPLELPDPGVTPAPAEPTEEAAPRPERGAPAPLESVPTSSSSDRGRGGAPIVLVGLAGAAAALWAYAGRDPADGDGLPGQPAPSPHPFG